MVQVYLKAISSRAAAIYTNLANAKAKTLVYSYPRYCRQYLYRCFKFCKKRLFRKMGFVRRAKTSAKVLIPDDSRKEKQVSVSPRNCRNC